MKINITTPFLVLAIALGACKSNVDHPQLMLVEITDPSCYSDRFEYENGNLVTHRRLFGEQVSSEKTFRYTGSRLEEIETLDENGAKYRTLLEYRSDGLRLRELRSTDGSSGTKLQTAVDFTYYENGNLKSKKILQS